MTKRVKILLTIFFLVLSYGLVFAAESFQTIIRDFSGGINTNDVADTLQPNQFASMVNVAIDRSGVVSKRLGQRLFNSSIDDALDTATPLRGIGRFDPDANTSYLIVASGKTIARSLSSETIWTSYLSTLTLTENQDTEFIQADDLFFIINGYDETAWYGGSWISESIEYPTSPPTAKTGCWTANYLFLAGATSENDWIYISTNLEPTSFPSTYVKKINTGDGQKIQKLLPYRINEVIVYKERSIFVLDITEAPDSTLSTWTVQPISTVIGTIAPRSVVSLGNDQWFLSSEPIAIRSLVRSEFDKILVDMVSKPIQDVFDGTGSLTINKTYISNACATLFDNKYFIAIPTGVSTVNNTVFVYDFLTNGWYRIDGWYPSAWQVFDNRLFYTDANDGSVVECFVGTSGDMGQGPYSKAASAYGDVGINFEVVTKDFDFDHPELYKMLDAIEVEFDPTGTYYGNIYANLDNNGWTSIGSVLLAGNSLTLPITLPSKLKDAGVARDTFVFDTQDEFRKIAVRVSNENAGEQIKLQRISIFGQYKPWRRYE